MEGRWRAAPPLFWVPAVQGPLVKEAQATGAALLAEPRHASRGPVESQGTGSVRGPSPQRRLVLMHTRWCCGHTQASGVNDVPELGTSSQPERSASEPASRLGLRPVLA